MEPELSTYTSYKRVPNPVPRPLTNPTTLLSLGLITFEEEKPKMSKHVPEPWFNYKIHTSRFQIGVYAPSGTCLSLADFSPSSCITASGDETLTDEQAIASKERAVACVNACAGIPNETLEELKHGGILAQMQNRDTAHTVLTGTISALSEKLEAAKRTEKLLRRVGSGVALALMLTIIVGVPYALGQINTAYDYAARIKEQYRDCAMIGQFPTNADMLPGDSGQ